MAAKKRRAAQKAPARKSKPVKPPRAAKSAKPAKMATATRPVKKKYANAASACSYSYGASPVHYPHHGYDSRNDTPPPKGPVFAPGRFGRMFPNLPGLVVPDAALDALAAAMLDPNGAPAGDNPAISSGFTYLGQFIDHDVTFDPTTMPEVLVDPQAVFNFRTPKLDLDSVYGTGPSTQPYLYELDRLHLIVGTTQVGGGDATIPAGMPNDLPRLNGTAVIGDPRNDENIVVAQTHLAMIKFHNKCVDKLVADGFPNAGVFAEARKLVTWHYQRMVLDDFLGRLCDPNVLDDVIQNGREFFHFAEETFVPVEFSVAAYRFGHSQVRGAYNYNRVFRFGGVAPATLALLFRFSGVSGPRTPDTIPVPSDWIIDWRRFYALDAAVAPDATRKIDPLLVQDLHQLPGGGGSLPARNLKRGVRMGLPSGQAIAAAMGIQGLSAAQLSGGTDGQVLAAQGLTGATPLWYYILKEAQVQQNGERLGVVGSRIVAETFLGMLEGDALSFKNQNPSFVPSLFKPGQSAATPGKYTMVDLLSFVDDINPIN